MYTTLSKLMLMDNYLRKIFVEKIADSLEGASDGRLVNTSYFLLSHFPFHDLSGLEDYSLRLHRINDTVRGVEFGEYLFGLKVNFVLKSLGFGTKYRKLPPFSV